MTDKNIFRWHGWGWITAHFVSLCKAVNVNADYDIFKRCQVNVN